MTIKTFVSKINIVAIRKEKAYDKKIAESQAKLAETTLVPGCTKIYC